MKKKNQFIPHKVYLIIVIGILCLNLVSANWTDTGNPNLQQAEEDRLRNNQMIAEQNFSEETKNLSSRTTAKAFIISTGEEVDPYDLEAQKIYNKIPDSFDLEEDKDFILFMVIGFIVCMIYIFIIIIKFIDR